MKTSGQSDYKTVKKYDSKPSKETISEDLRFWASGFGSWSIAEHVSYGYEKLSAKIIPKNRADLLKKHTAAWKKFEKTKLKKDILTSFFKFAPFNGQKDLTTKQ